MTKKYIVWPGWVISATDGQRHHVGGAQIAALYGVRPDDCIFAEPEKSTAGALRNIRLLQRDDLTHLYPRNNGDYTLPK